MQAFRTLLARQQTAIVFTAVFGLNAILCFPLFWTEYLDDFQSNEGAFMTIARFLVEHWPHTAWFPWFNGGTPIENAYFPLVPAMVALGAAMARCSTPLAFHFLTATFYSLGPAFLFLFVRKAAARTTPALVAALAWSLLSPAALVPEIRRQMETPWGLRRLQTIVYFGETPHNVALSLLPLFWLLLLRYLEKPSARRFAPAAVVAGGIMLSNAFGITVVAISTALLVVSIAGFSWRRLLGSAGVLLTAYLLICRFLPPSLLRQVAASAQTLGGDYRIRGAALVPAILFLPVMAGLWFALRPFTTGVFRFAALFAGGFGGIAVLWHWQGIGLLPSAHRYILEAEVGAALLLGFALSPLLRWKVSKAAAGVALIALFALDYGFARRSMRPLDIASTIWYRQARWIGQHLPGQRVMASGESEFWMNLFVDNPQLSAGHEAAANWVERVAVYTIYSGQNAGDQDGPISVLWLKAFGCGAITVPGAGSGDHFHPVSNPRKFDGLLPLVWREGDDSIYQVPLRSASLAHVVPGDSIVRSRPAHGLDVGPLHHWVDALEDPAVEPAALTWRNPETGTIAATLKPGQVISVQITYDRGWRARVHGDPVEIHRDGLGMMFLAPRCTDCIVDVEFEGGRERRICSVIAALTAALLALAALMGRVARIPSA